MISMKYVVYHVCYHFAQVFATFVYFHFFFAYVSVFYLV